MPPAGQPAQALRDRAERHVFGLLPDLPAIERRVLALLELADADRASAAVETGLDDTALRFAAKRARKALRRDTAPLAAGARCERAELLLSDRLDAPLARQERKWLEIHLARCPRCEQHETLLATARADLLATFLAEPPALPPAPQPPALEPAARLRVVPPAPVGGQSDPDGSFDRPTPAAADTGAPADAPQPPDPPSPSPPETSTPADAPPPVGRQGDHHGPFDRPTPVPPTPADDHPTPAPPTPSPPIPSTPAETRRAPKPSRPTPSAAKRRALTYLATLLVLAALIGAAIAAIGQIDTSPQHAPWDSPDAPEVHPSPLIDQ
ncbi:MAG: zf-HC2 domain-containing protein [Solirubrobacteraceae bacterium]